MAAALLVPQLAVCQKNAEGIGKAVANEILRQSFEKSKTSEKVLAAKRDATLSEAISKHNWQQKALVRNTSDPRQMTLFGIPLVLRGSASCCSSSAGDVNEGWGLVNAYTFKDSKLKSDPDFLRIDKFKDESYLAEEGVWTMRNATEEVRGGIGLTSFSFEYLKNPTDVIMAYKMEKEGYVPYIQIDRIFAGKEKGTFFHVQMYYPVVRHNQELFNGLYKALKQAPQELFTKNFVEQYCELGPEAYY